jgi:predicted O-linked N-acetylglucosamine transferase (SPINDLY family)
MALKALGRAEEAVAAYDRALTIRPDLAAALNNRGNALCDLHRPDEALASYERALAGAPDFVEAHYGRGNALQGLRRFDEALLSYDRALALRLRYAEALNNRGHALTEMGRAGEALAHYDRALGVKPDLAEAHFNRGLALTALKQGEQALASFEAAFALAPEYPTLRGRLLHAKMQICDWREIEPMTSALVGEIQAGRCASAPFTVVGLVDSPQLQRRAAELYQGFIAPSRPAPAPPPTRRRDKIRIGYFSCDFRDHAGAHLMAGLLEQHDRSRFEIFAFSFGSHAEDEMRRRIVAGVDRFIDINRASDLDAAVLARGLEIDIAVDRNGYSAGCRPSIFAHRAAPIQVAFLGYPGTTGAPHIDYIVADRTVIPAETQAFYAEKIAYLPHSYQANDDKRVISDRAFTRAECGLPQTGFVFCCFNNNYKITPEIFDIWMRMLRQVDGAVLWLLQDNPAAARNLRGEADARGVDAGRLVFAPRMPVAEHLARHRLADLFLDTRPYNAHTTASDALWAGLPVLTCPGESFAARVAASLLHAVGLPELVAEDLSAYEAFALELARDPVRLAGLKQKLADNRQTRPLFDTALFARHIEAAYAAMYARQQAGLPPEAFSVMLPEG